MKFFQPPSQPPIKPQHYVSSSHSQQQFNQYQQNRLPDLVFSSNPSQRRSPPPPPPTIASQLTGDIKKKSAPPPPPPPPPPLSQMSVSNNSNTTTTTTTNKPPPAPPINDARAGLLQQIQAGAKLKAVGMPAADKTPVPTNPLNHRDHMMDQIKQGAQLKHVGFFYKTISYGLVYQDWEGIKKS